MTAVDDLEPGFAALAAEGRRLEPRVLGSSTRTSEGSRTVWGIETAGLPTPEVGGPPDAPRAFRRHRGLAAESVIVGTTGGACARLGATHAPDR